MKIKVMLLFTFFFLYSCKNSDYIERTKYFEDYLQTYHKISMPQESYDFVIIDGISCPSCVKGQCYILKTKDKLKENTSIIFTSFSQEARAALKASIKHVKVYYDSTNELSSYGLSLNTSAIVSVKNKQIVNIKYLDINNYKDIEQFL